jgi:ribosome-associated protein
MENTKPAALNAADSGAVSRAIASVLIEKRAIDVRMYKVAETSAITDYYVNATGRSALNTAALAGYVTDELSLRGVNEQHIEGKSGGAWILIDYGDVIVNVFDKESRDFYNFDRLMAEGTEVDISDIIAEVDSKLAEIKKITI